jgi:hypothetical protein
LRHDRVAQRDDVKAFCEHSRGELPGQCRVAKHAGHGFTGHSQAHLYCPLPVNPLHSPRSKNRVF